MNGNIKNQKEVKKGVSDLETVFTKEELLRVIINWLFLQKPKDAKIKFIDTNGIELSGIEKIVIQMEK